jgi:hypothetical protein
MRMSLASSALSWKERNPFPALALQETTGQVV